MKKFWKIGAVGLMGLAITTTCGCGLMFDPNAEGSGIKALDGYKICYNDGTYQVDDTFNVYSRHVLSEIITAFALPSEGAYTSALAVKPLATKENFDRVRVQKGVDGSAVKTSWKWTFAQSFAGAVSQESFDEALTYYTAEKQQAYLGEYLSIYTAPLEVVAMQIASGQAPSVFTVQVNENTGKTNVFTDAGKTTLVDESFVASQKTLFEQRANYVGFTEENVASFKAYILEHVVGPSIIGTNADFVNMPSGQVKYEVVLDEILKLRAPTAKDFLTPYPASWAKDVFDTTYYPDNNRVDPLEGIPAYEYQSVTFMAKKEVELLSIMLQFYAPEDMDIEVNVQYFDSEKSAASKLFETTVQVRQSQDGGYALCLMAFSGTTKLKPFGTNFMSGSGPVAITNQNGLSEYFLWNDGASLEPLAVNNFLTITFKVQGGENGYKPFKWAINSLIIGE